MDGRMCYGLFKKFDMHLMRDEKPSNYFNNMLSEGIFYESYPLTLLGNLVKTNQEPKHHPEGNVWNHTMLVIDKCAENKGKSENSRVFMWAGLLHDLGKAPTTALRKGKVTSYDHDKVGAKLAKDFLQEFTEDSNFIDGVSRIVRWHMQTLFVVKDLPFAEVENMLSQVSLEEIALFSLCDRLGRGGMDKEKIAEEKNNVEAFIKKCRHFQEKMLKL